MPDRDPEIRAFIAIELPEEVKCYLRELVEDWKRLDRGVKWTRSEGIHLTLKFLGNVDRSGLEAIKEFAGPVFAGRAPFSLSVAGTGAFPNPKRPRVIWAGVDDYDRILEPMVKDLETALEPLGFEPEKRRFNPHLTIGRVKAARISSELIEAMTQMRQASGPAFHVDRGIFYQSVLKPSGAEYVPLAEFPLAER